MVITTARGAGPCPETVIQGMRRVGAFDVSGTHPIWATTYEPRIAESEDVYSLIRPKFGRGGRVRRVTYLSDTLNGETSHDNYREVQEHELPCPTARTYLPIPTDRSQRPSARHGDRAFLRITTVRALHRQNLRISILPFTLSFGGEWPA